MTPIDDPRPFPEVLSDWIQRQTFWLILLSAEILTPGRRLPISASIDSSVAKHLISAASVLIGDVVEAVEGLHKLTGGKLGGHDDELLNRAGFSGG